MHPWPFPNWRLVVQFSLHQALFFPLPFSSESRRPVLVSAYAPVPTFCAKGLAHSILGDSTFDHIEKHKFHTLFQKSETIHEDAQTDMGKFLHAQKRIWRRFHYK